MEIDARKLRILAAVVDEYIVTGEPVGSKAVAAHADIRVSPATIRNDMAMLEQLGYLEQPHTSAGRIPTYSGYRLYIERFIGSRGLPEDEQRRLDSMLKSGGSTEESIIQSAADALAELTNCAAVVSNSSPQFSVITKVEVIPTGKRLYVILLITSDGSIKNKACRLEFDLTDEQLEFFTSYMQDNLHGVKIENLSEEMLIQLVTALGAYMVTLSPLVNSIYELTQDFMKQEVNISGEQNLLACKEYDKSDIVNFYRHKNEMLDLLDESFSGIRVVFSEETGDFIIGNSSMIVSKFRKDGKEAGSLGIIGPMRLDYAKIIPYIEYLTQRITDILSEDEENTE